MAAIPTKELTEEQKARVQRYAYLQLKVQLEERLAKDEISEFDKLFEMFDNMKRKSNVDWGLRFQNGIFQTAGKNLRTFCPAQRPGPLQPGEERYFVDVEIDGQLVRRSCIIGSDDSTRIEVPRVYSDGQRVNPTLHVSVDELDSIIDLKCVLATLTKCNHYEVTLRQGTRALLNEEVVSVCRDAPVWMSMKAKAAVICANGAALDSDAD